MLLAPCSLLHCRSSAAAAGVCALWGPLHGGANQAVIEMLDAIQASGISVAEYVIRGFDGDVLAVPPPVR